MALGDPYVTEDELQEHLGITAKDRSDALVLAANAASRWVERHTGRQFNLATTATARVFDRAHSGFLLVDDIGHATIGVASDTSADGSYATTWATSDFQTFPQNALADGHAITRLYAVGDYTFPTVDRRTGLVQVTARWGWPAVPADVKMATLILAAQLFKRRDSVDGVLGGGDFGVVRIGSRIDRDVFLLLEPYQLTFPGVA